METNAEIENDLLRKADMEKSKNTVSSKDKRECLKCKKREAVQCKGQPLVYECMNCGTILVYTPQ